MPCGLRWPIEYTALRAPAITGLSPGVLPSRWMRRTLPFRLLRFCARGWLLASPMVTHSRPNRSISSAQPLWTLLAAMPPIMIVRVDPVAVGGDRIAKHLVLPPAALGVLPRGADVHVPVRGEVHVDRDAHQAGLAHGADARDVDGADQCGVGMPLSKMRTRPGRSVTSILPSGRNPTSHGILESGCDAGRDGRRSSGRDGLRPEAATRPIASVSVRVQARLRRRR